MSGILEKPPTSTVIGLDIASLEVLTIMLPTRRTTFSAGHHKQKRFMQQTFVFYPHFSSAKYFHLQHRARMQGAMRFSLDLQPYIDRTFAALFSAYSHILCSVQLLCAR